MYEQAVEPAAVGAKNPIKRIVVLLFVFVYLSPILFFSIWPIFCRGPQPRSLANYLQFLGLKQGFQLFAPNPISKNTLVEAVVRFEDNSAVIWRKPLSHADGLRSLTDYRFRKLITYHLPKKGREPLITELAQYLLWKYRDAPSPVKKIEIYRFVSKIPRPFEREGVLQFPNPGYKKFLLLEVRAPFKGDADFIPLLTPRPVTQDGDTIDSE